MENFLNNSLLIKLISPPFYTGKSLIKKELRHTLGTPGGLTVFCFSRGQKDFAGPYFYILYILYCYHPEVPKHKKSPEKALILHMQITIFNDEILQQHKEIANNIQSIK